MQIHSTQSGFAARRGGFTMLELLIVLSIIAILASISFVVYGAALENAREESTKATLRQLDSALQERLDAFKRVNLKSQAQRFKLQYDNASPANTPATVPLEIAEIVVRKDRYKAAFPQRLEDLWGFNGAPGGGDDAPLWLVYCRLTSNPVGSPPATRDPKLESSELLFLTLTNGGAFGAPVLSLDRLRGNHVRDAYPAGGNGISELYDEWGQPLRFYNLPTRLVRPGGEASAGPPITQQGILLTNYRGAVLPLIPGIPKITGDLAFNTYSHPLNQDPDDPTGALIAAQDTTNIFRANFALGTTTGQQPVREGFYGTLDTYSLPLIVSAGPDEKLGLNEPAMAGATPARLAEPLDLADLDPLFDNITNRQP